MNIIGTSPDSIEMAEDRKLFAAMLHKLKIPQPANGLAVNEEEALEASKKLGYPVLVRPSFVLGGRAMQIVYSDAELRQYMRFAVEASPERPVLVDKFLEHATEVDVDCICDAGTVSHPEEATIVIGGMLEHIEFAGVHSGAAFLPRTPRGRLSRRLEYLLHGTGAQGVKADECAVCGKDEVLMASQPSSLADRPAQGDWRAAPARNKVMADRSGLGFTDEIGILGQRNRFFPSIAFRGKIFCYLLK